MELDRRIVHRDYIFDCFSIDKAKKYIGTNGYFADYIEDFVDLDCLDFCELKIIESEFKYPYCIDGDSFKFFLPCEFVKYGAKQEKEKKFRPYTMDEFLDVFPIGQPIRYRKKKYNVNGALVFNGYEIFEDGKINIRIGGYDYTLEILFEDYEWQKSNSEEYVPFGVEE